MNTYKDAIEILETIDSKTQIELVEIIFDIAKISPSSICKALMPETKYKIILTDCGAKKIACIKEIRTITGLSLKDSKDFSDSTPHEFPEIFDIKKASEIKSIFAEIGATVKVVTIN